MRTATEEHRDGAISPPVRCGNDIAIRFYSNLELILA